MIVAALFLVLGVHFATSEECEYAKYNPKHIMCMYPKDGLSKYCNHVILGAFDEGKKKCLLDVHNELRNNIAQGYLGEQPKAANMKELKWDSELAIIAQREANQCQNPDVESSARATSEFSQVGQIFALESYRAAISCEELQQSVRRWIYEGVKKMKDAYVENYPNGDTDKTIGRYSQVLWAETTNLGCGMFAYKVRDLIHTHIFCNYGPSGNIANKPIYKKGEPATQCENGVSPNYSGLCL